MAKALPCKGVKIHKLKVAFISKILRFYGVKALNLEDLFATLWINNAEAHLRGGILSGGSLCRLYGIGKRFVRVVSFTVFWFNNVRAVVKSLQFYGPGNSTTLHNRLRGKQVRIKL